MNEKLNTMRLQESDRVNNMLDIEQHVMCMKYVMDSEREIWNIWKDVEQR